MLNIDFTTTIGKIKPMHAVNNMPTIPYDSYGLYSKYTEAHIPYARLHDTGGPFGGARYVDIENIFPNFDADENDPASYDFVFTDAALEEMAKAGVKPFYRLGCTIENQCRIKAYHIYPPKDSAKWARICEHIIMHYNEGWADGYNFGIEYWEIWNEPDNEPDMMVNPMWRGTKEQYFELYDVTSKYLKSRFPDLKIGGYSSCGFYALYDGNFSEVAHSSTRTGYFIEFFIEFLEYIKDHNSPLDFFSYHSYADLEKNKGFSAFAEQKLKEYGYGDVELIFNEWNPGINERGKAVDASNIASMMIAMHGTGTTMCMYYDGAMRSTYCGLFDPVGHGTFKAYNAFRAFGELYVLENQVVASCDDAGVYVLAAANDGKGAALIVNSNDEAVSIENNFENKVLKFIATDEEHDYEEVISFGDRIELPPHAVWLLESEIK